jgi:hypothetical protein
VDLFISGCGFDRCHDRLESLKRSPCRVKGSESLTRSDPAFDGSVVLLHNIIQVAYGPASALPAEFALCLSSVMTLG